MAIVEIRRPTFWKRIIRSRFFHLIDPSDHFQVIIRFGRENFVDFWRHVNTHTINGKFFFPLLFLTLNVKMAGAVNEVNVSIKKALKCQVYISDDQKMPNLSTARNVVMQVSSGGIFARQIHFHETSWR